MVLQMNRNLPSEFDSINRNTRGKDLCTPMLTPLDLEDVTVPIRDMVSFKVCVLQEKQLHTFCVHMIEHLRTFFRDNKSLYVE